ncbi:MAG TPA: LCP family protein [Acidimicrobiia bacterium]|nr:LCP family protein [Acidimicrobiia bacterium]
MRRLSTLLVVLVACSSQTTIPNTSNPPSTPPSTTTITTTAPTTAAPGFLSGGSEGWSLAVADVYGPACGGDRAMVPAELSGLAVAETCPQGGTATVAQVSGATLASAVIGEDHIFGADYGEGFSVVAARLPSLGQAAGWYGGTPKIVAVIGADARPGEEPAVTRADSIHLVGLNGQGAGGMVGIPRDSWVPIGGGSSNKINAALSQGGPDVLMSTLTATSGLDIGGYVLTGFEGFQEMWGNILGGAEVDVPVPISDPASGADFSSGRQYLNGPQALAFGRARKSLPGGDLTRQFHGGVALIGALQQVQARGPLELPGLIAASEPWMRTNIRWDDLLAFSALAQATPTEAIGNVVAPARVGSVGAASVVFLTEAAAATFADLADGAIAP